MKKSILFSVIVFSLIFLGFAKEKNKKGQVYSPTYFKSDYEFISTNRILMWVSNSGDGSFNPITNASGFYWPGGAAATKTAIFEDGLVWGGLIDSMPRVNGSTYRHGCLPGRILDDGLPDDPSAERNRIYKIRRDWEMLPDGEEKAQYEKDYYEWPGEWGAPYIDVNKDGKFTRGIDKPEFVGDEVLWWVMNDLDTATSRFTYGSDPIGLEVQVTVWAFSKASLLGDVVFKKYKIINKGNDFVKDMYLGYWADVDLGSATDDFVGCDTSLNLGYSYNEEAIDYIYGENVPAVGYQFLETPSVPSSLSDTAFVDGNLIAGKKNLPMTSFVLYIGGSSKYRDPLMGEIDGTFHFYNNMRGKIWNGDSYVDPNTGVPTSFCLSGDPVNGTGWYEGEGWPGGLKGGDRRMFQSTGPFDFAPGDTQNIVIAIPIAFQENYIQSVAFLKERCRRLQKIYYNKFNPSVKKPSLNAYVKESEILLWWQGEQNKFVDLNTSEDNLDSLYKFEGFRVWQFSDEAGNNPTPIKVFDLKNDVNELFSYSSISNIPVLTSDIRLNNDGILRYVNIDKDYLNNLPLLVDNEYYFGLTVLYTAKNLKYNADLYELTLNSYYETEPVIIKTVPSRNPIDWKTPTNVGEVYFAEHLSGKGDGYVATKIIDPLKITGGEYKVIFSGNEDSLTFSLINEQDEDTIIFHSNDIPEVKKNEFGDYTISANDTMKFPLIDGFQFWLRNIGKDSLNVVKTKYRVKDVLEIISQEESHSVWQKPNSTGKWQIIAKGPSNRLNWQYGGEDAIGTVDYEIRFGESSQYYVSGDEFSLPITVALHNDSLGLGSVPFQIWDIGRTPEDPSDDKRLAIKILDNSPWDSSLTIPDRKWSRLPNGDWEEIYAFEPEGWNADTSIYPDRSGLTNISNHKFGALVIRGDLPEPGTVIRITTWKPLSPEDTFVISIPSVNLNDKEYAKTKIDEITVFPNPFYGIRAEAENSIKVTFTNLPKEVTILIYSLSGHLVKKLSKSIITPFLEWDLRNMSGLLVSSGIYIAHLDMPGIGEKIMKIAVVF